MIIEGRTWRYSVCGQGKKNLLLIISNFIGEYLSLPIAEQFQSEYRILALSLPPNPSYQKGIEGLYTILKEENFDPCDVVGHSMGGCYIQGLVRKYPELVNKIVFSHASTVMSAQDKETINARDIKACGFILKVLPVLPMTLIKKKLGSAIIGNVSMSSPEAIKVLNKLVRENFSKITKKDFSDVIKGMLDFLKNEIFSSAHYVQKPEKILLIDSEDDSVVTRQQLDEMYQLCPGAKSYRFKNGGHVTIFTRTQEYLEVLKSFLRL